MFLAEALRCERALDGERLCGERGRLRVADTAFGGVILRIFSGGRPRGSENTAYLLGAGVMKFLRKRVRLRSSEL